MTLWSDASSNPLEDIKNAIRMAKENHDRLMERRTENAKIHFEQMKRIAARYGYELTEKGELKPMQEPMAVQDTLKVELTSGITEETVEIAVPDEVKKKKRGVRDHVGEDEVDTNKLKLLVGMRNMNTYQGTVDAETIRRRRAKNKRARAARRKSRS